MDSYIRQTWINTLEEIGSKSSQTIKLNTEDCRELAALLKVMSQ